MKTPQQKGKSRWWMAAAVFIGLVIVGMWFFTGRDKVSEKPVAVTPVVEDVKAPELNRAMISLADGSRIYLDSAAQGDLALQGNMKLVKLADGQVVYETASGEVLKEMQYNTLVNPRGSKVISLTLGDGTRVWLNAGSSVKYPVAFYSGIRTVEIKGEAYFEVAKDAAKKFLVDANGMMTEVLGTHFNVNAYDDEDAVRVTLLEGSVKVSNNLDAVFIQPGEQVSGRINSKLQTSQAVDLDRVMAWKNGWFEFTDYELPAIMRQISRWYDVAIVYKGKPTNDMYVGRISNSLPLSDILKMLENSGSGVTFKIEGKTITVQP